ncbi:MAG: hypothetical protein ACXADY_10685 [Candidatus Hodarchaeales archaeon]|jgi:hypothetical protein
MIADINEFQSQEDAIDYFHGYRLFIKRRISKHEKRFKRMTTIKEELDKIILEINTWEELKIDELKTMLKKIKDKSKSKQT